MQDKRIFLKDALIPGIFGILYYLYGPGTYGPVANKRRKNKKILSTLFMMEERWMILI